ncbi:MAG: ATP-binding protein [Myxococcota bacterium]|nr:ATP-binding protein [Myxococcota bacterium]
MTPLPKMIARWPAAYGSGLALVLLASTTLALGLGARSGVQRSLNSQNTLLAEQLGERLESCFVTRVAMVVAIKREWELGGLRSEGAYAARAASLIEGFPGFLAINRVDEHGVIDFVYPPEANQQALGRRVTDKPHSSQTFQDALQAGTAQLTPPGELFQGGTGVAIYVPYSEPDGSHGAINGVFRADTLIPACLGKIGVKDRSLELLDGTAVLYSRQREADPGLMREEAVPVLNRTWTLRLTPSSSVVSAAHRPVRLLLSGGLTLSVLLSSLLFGFLRGRQRALLREQKSLDERRKLESQLQQAQKMEALGRLAGGVAHDFNNLLTVIQTGASLLHRDPDCPDRDQLIAEIEEAGQRAAGLTRELLTLGRGRTELAPIDLTEVVSGLKGLLTRMVRSNIISEIHTPHQPTPILGNQVQLEQILVNLVMNAVDAMPQGGNLQVELGEEGDQALLTVQDTGTGISTELGPRIFEPFFTTKELGHGTGLGLATVYGHVQRMKGEIQVESEVGRGTTFKVRLPLHTEEQPAAAEVVAPAASELTAPRTVLLVENDPPVRVALSRLLRQSGFQVQEAESGQQAVQRLSDPSQAQPEVVLSDVVMPQMGGVELWKWVRANRPELPILLMSGYPGEALDDLDLSGLGITLLQKPVEEATLVHALRTALGQPPPHPAGGGTTG